ncbi:MAG: hypothetical protein GC168_02815 [Candidatus Hydrogenedens sp.]|nr:hypothetical protein [Candidatus Hydrogenedens sp.]
MAIRVHMVEEAEAPEDIRREFAYQVEKNGRITNMKRTLLQSLPAYRAYMEWYTLRDEIEPFIGARGVVVFSHAISTQTDCLICSTFFRRYLIDSGENPDDLALSDTEQLLVDYGRQVAQDPNNVSDALFERLAARFSEKEIVLLTAFAGIMIATNIFNNALRIPLDEVLECYRAQAPQGDDV